MSALANVADIPLCLVIFHDGLDQVLDDRKVVRRNLVDGYAKVLLDLAELQPRSLVVDERHGASRLVVSSGASDAVKIRRLTLLVIVEAYKQIELTKSGASSTVRGRS